MKITYTTTLLALNVLLILSCNKKQEQPQQEKFTITGQVTGFPDGTKFYLKYVATNAFIDSTTVEKNRFSFEGHLINAPEELDLVINIENNFIFAPLLIGNDDITIKGDISDFPWDVTITGSKFQDEFNYARSITKEHWKQRDSLSRVYYTTLTPEEQNKTGKEFRKKLKKIDSIRLALETDHIKSNPNTYANVIMLGYLKDKLPKDTVQKIYDSYSPEIKNSRYAKVTEVFLKEKITEIGDTYHDFEGTNQEDETVVFSKIRGAYTLLDFTSAFCVPCIQAADELVEVNKSYADSLTIVSFNQDPKKEDWLRSLERDKVAWNSLWDGKGRYSETSIKYGANGVPMFILINPEGTVIDKWFGYRKGLIKENLNKKFKSKTL